ncbi:H-NS histone family protein [Bradyrhizobium guangdongense]|nr:H-NS histone family protein [Bradyrhizobium guangdongense]GGI33824.1 trans-acting regulatory protein hvrA [Bradyrhizobium guangdongense]
MTPIELDTCSTDELWTLYEAIVGILQRRLEGEMRQLDERLVALRGRFQAGSDKANRSPRFRNPGDPSQTWSGRGKRPRWVTELLKTGVELEELRAQQSQSG